MALPHDPLWTRAGSLLQNDAGPADVTIIGVPAHRTSISATNAHTTPAAVRDALLRYSSYSASADLDLRDLRVVDVGDVDDCDSPDGELRTSALVAQAVATARLTVVLGGDNSVTFAAARGVAQHFADDWTRVGLITFDAHHDLRDGVSNGSPVRRLTEAGLPGSQIVQIGISDFANSREYSSRARDLGITVIRRDAMRGRAMTDVMAEAFDAIGEREIFVDVDVDVCDRSVVPACPASVPGGISADELRQLVRLATSDSRVRAIDFTEVDATADAPDQRTVRLVATCVLEAIVGSALNA